MTTRQTRQAIRDGGAILALAALASCVAPPKPAPAPPPRPLVWRSPGPPVTPPPDWRDVPLTSGTWVWHGGAGQVSIAQFGVPGQPTVFALRCDVASSAIIFSRSRSAEDAFAFKAMTFTTSFGVFSLPTGHGNGQPPAIVAQANARDPRLDQLAFSRGRFLVDMAGQPRLVLPAWPEVARVIEDCR